MTDAGADAPAIEEIARGQRWVPGYEGAYSLDERGEVYSCARTFDRVNRGRNQTVRVPGRRLTQCLNRNGYPFVRLYHANKAKTFEVHRLVCRAFHGEPTAGQEAAHADGDRTHSAASNLRWASRSDNHRDKQVHGTHLTGERVSRAKLTAVKAAEVCRRALLGEGVRALGREFSIDEAAVRKIKRGTLWAAETKAVREYLKERQDG